MSLVSELEKLEQLRQSGSLSQHEFAIAKRKLLNDDSHDQQVADSQVVKIQNDIEELDRSWQIDRENYMVAGKYGHRHIPNKTTSVISGIGVTGFGIFWTIMAGSMSSAAPGPAQFFPLFGVMFVIFGAVISYKAYQKAEGYEQAQAAYQKKRKELLARKSNR